MQSKCNKSTQDGFLCSTLEKKVISIILWMPVQVCAFQLFRDFTLGLTHGCTDRGTDGPCNNLLPKQARSNKLAKPDGTQSNNSPSNKTREENAKNKTPPAEAPNSTPGVAGRFKRMALNSSVCASTGTSVSLQAKPCMQTTWREVKTHRVAYWQNVCMHLCATADITKTVWSYNKRKLKQERELLKFLHCFWFLCVWKYLFRELWTPGISDVPLMLRAQNNKMSHINPSQFET